ncbi:MAG: hypothetical protein OXH07_08395 [Chloroflexi bacterium]|nr:hypothetical protein [Chloroflexota bacterium]
MSPPVLLFASYLDSAQVSLDRAFHARDAGSDIGSQQFILRYLVDCLFAIEIGLKTIVAYSKRDLGSVKNYRHDLAKLYRDCPRESRRSIERDYKEKYPSRGKAFEDTMSTANGLYTTLRYFAFEGGSVEFDHGLIHEAVVVIAGELKRLAIPGSDRLHLLKIDEEYPERLVDAGALEYDHGYKEGRRSAEA